jgi:hypothetical protein
MHIPFQTQAAIQAAKTVSWPYDQKIEIYLLSIATQNYLMMNPNITSSIQIIKFNFVTIE